MCMFCGGKLPPRWHVTAVRWLLRILGVCVFSSLLWMRRKAGGHGLTHDPIEVIGVIGLGIVLILLSFGGHWRHPLHPRKTNDDK